MSAGRHATQGIILCEGVQQIGAYVYVYVPVDRRVASSRFVGRCLLLHLFSTAVVAVDSVFAATEREAIRGSADDVVLTGSPPRRYLAVYGYANPMGKEAGL